MVRLDGITPVVGLPMRLYLYRLGGFVGHQPASASALRPGDETASKSLTSIFTA